jgi:hypothetical protein
MSHDSRHMAQLQKEERRMKEEVELMKGQMKAVVAKSVALERQMATADGNVLTTEQQLRQALVAGDQTSSCVPPCLHFTRSPLKRAPCYVVFVSHVTLILVTDSFH